MNNSRRKDIAEIVAKLADLEALKSEIQGMVESVRDEEQEYYDNMPEGLQQSDRGYRAEEAASQLDNVYNMFDDLDIDSMTSDLESAAE